MILRLKILLNFFSLLFIFGTSIGCSNTSTTPIANYSRNFFDLSATNIAGERVSFDRYRGNVILVTNIALKCGTTPQLKAIQSLYEDYKTRGLIILGFPSDDFSKQEPKDSSVIQHTCQSAYGVTFPLFESSSITGLNMQPVFKFLTTSGEQGIQGEVGFNFEKFLISKKGYLVERYGPFTSATSKRVQSDIEDLLNE